MIVARSIASETARRTLTLSNGGFLVLRTMISTCALGTETTFTLESFLSEASRFAGGDTAMSARPPRTAVARAVSSVTTWKVILSSWAGCLLFQ